MSDDKRLEAGGAIVYASNNSDENIIKLQESTKYNEDITISKSGDSLTEEDTGSNAAIFLYNSANYILANSELYINGKQADGIYISDKGSSGTINGSNISIAGTESAGIYNNGGISKLANNNAIISANNSNVLNSIGGTNTIDTCILETSSDNEDISDSSIVKVSNLGLVNSQNSQYTSYSNSYSIDMDSSTFESTNDIFTSKKYNNFHITGKQNSLTLSNAKLSNESEDFAIICVDNGIVDIYIDKGTTYTGNLFDIKNNSIVNLNIENMNFNLSNISVDNTSELNIKITKGTLNLENNKLDGYIKVSLVSAKLNLTDVAYISEFDEDFDSNLVQNDHDLFVNGEVFVEGLQIGSVVNYTSDDKSIYERNCIIIRKRLRPDDTVEFIVYDADDHIAYIANQSNLKSTGKSVDITPLLDEIEALLKDIDVYKSGTTIVEKDPDEPGIIVDGTVVSLTDMTVLKSGDSQRDDHSYNSAVYVLNSGSLSLDKSTIRTTGKYSDGLLVTTKSNTELSDSKITTEGESSNGIEVTSGGNVSSTNNTISVEKAPYAVKVDNSKITITGGEYTSPVYGVDVSNESSAILNNTTVNVDDAAVTLSAPADSKVDNTVSVTESTLNANSYIFSTTHSTNVINVKDSTLNLSKGTTNPAETVFNNPDCDTIINIENTGINFNGFEDADTKYIASSGLYIPDGDNLISNLTINAKKQNLIGNFIVQEGSTLTLNLDDNSLFDGWIDNRNPDGKVIVNLTNNSTWKLEADTYVETFSKDDTSTIDFNGFNIYVYDKDDTHTYIKYEEKHPGTDVDHYDNEEDKINVRTLKVITEKYLPHLRDRDKNTIYLVYDKMEIYIYRSKFNDPFTITDKLPDKNLLVNNMLYILSQDEAVEDKKDDTPSSDTPSESGEETSTEPTTEPTTPEDPQSGDTGESTTPSETENPSKDTGSETTTEPAVGDGESGESETPQDQQEDQKEIIVSPDDEQLHFKAGDVIAYLDYQEKLVGRLNKDAEDYEDALKILRAANTVTFLNSESRYIDKQNRRINLPFQNGDYQLSLNLDEDLEVNDHTYIKFNQQTEQWELNGDHSIEDLKLRNPDRYTGKTTNTARVDVTNKDITTNIRLSDSPNNGLKVRGTGLFVDVSKFTNYDDFAVVLQAFITYKNIMDGYSTEIAEAVNRVTGSVSKEVINEKIANTLSAYEPTIKQVLDNYDAIRSEMDEATRQSTSVADEKIEKAKQDILDYVNQQEDPWVKADEYTNENALSDNEYSLQSSVLSKYRSIVNTLRPNETSTDYNSYGLTQDEQTAQDNLIYNLNSAFKTLDCCITYSTYEELPNPGTEGYRYIVSAESVYQIYVWNGSEYVKIYDINPDPEPDPDQPTDPSTDPSGDTGDSGDSESTDGDSSDTGETSGGDSGETGGEATDPEQQESGDSGNTGDDSGSTTGSETSNTEDTGSTTNPDDQQDSGSTSTDTPSTTDEDQDTGTTTDQEQQEDTGDNTPTEENQDSTNKESDSTNNETQDSSTTTDENNSESNNSTTE